MLVGFVFFDPQNYRCLYNRRTAEPGKKFLKNNAAEIRMEAFDVLKQNQAFTHSIGSNYYDYINSNVLKPYAMISFVYTIR